MSTARHALRLTLSALALALAPLAAPLAASATTATPTPTINTFKVVNGDEIVVTWTVPTGTVSKVKSFQILCTSDPEHNLVVGTVDSLGLSYLITGLKPGTLYFVEVQAVGTNGVTYNSGNYDTAVA